MKLPVIKHLAHFAFEKDEDFLIETAETLENLTECEGLSDGDIDAIGEVLSNLYGAIEVVAEVHNGVPEKAALNAFMKRVVGAIDK